MNNYDNLKDECCRANHELPTLGLVDLTWGNVSVMDRRAGDFAIKPSGVAYANLKREDMVVVDLEGKVVEGTLRFSSDTPTHRRLYQAFPAANSVVHTHSRHATSFAQAGWGIPCFGTTHADHFFGEVPITRLMTTKEIEGEYEWETGNVIVERFITLDPEKVTAVLVHSHGPFVWGPTSAKALEDAFALEVVSEMAWRTLGINSRAELIDPVLLHKHFSRKHGANAYYGQKSGSK
jgi:L-ribulose-5-phosphate 4-epimerase